MLGPTTLAGAPVVAVSGDDGRGDRRARSGARRAARPRAARTARRPAGPARLAIDRVFAVKGRGTVVTGTLRGGPLSPGATLRLEPGGFRSVRASCRSRGVAVETGGPGGRLAMNLAGVDRGTVARGAVLTDDPAVVATDRLLVALRPALNLQAGGARRGEVAAGTPVRLHLGTTAVEGVVRRSRRDVHDPATAASTAILRLATPVAAAPGDRFVLRRPSPPEPLAGGRVLDPRPPTGAAWRRATATEVGPLAAATTAGERAAALLALHGALARSRPEVAALPADAAVPAGRLVLGPAVAAAVGEEAMAAVRATGGDGVSLAELRVALARVLRRHASVEPALAVEAGGAIVESLVAAGRLARTGDLVHEPGRSAGPAPEILAAMERLETALDTPAPPSLADAARDAGCPAAGIQALEAAGRIIRVEGDLAWSAPAFARLQATALRLATPGPLAPATLRDATGTSRKYAMALLDELNRRGVLARTSQGHVRGPRADRVTTTPPADDQHGIL